MLSVLFLFWELLAYAVTVWAPGELTFYAFQFSTGRAFFMIYSFRARYLFFFEKETFVATL